MKLTNLPEGAELINFASRTNWGMWARDESVESAE